MKTRRRSDEAGLLLLMTTLDNNACGSLAPFEYF